MVLHNHSHTFAIADVPDVIEGGLEIYEFLSAYDEVTVSIKNWSVIGKYRHIAPSLDRVFVYDIEQHECRGSLGPYSIQIL
jgi:hypothetical protein